MTEPLQVTLRLTPAGRASELILFDERPGVGELGGVDLSSYVSDVTVKASAVGKTELVVTLTNLSVNRPDLPKLAKGSYITEDHQ